MEGNCNQQSERTVTDMGFEERHSLNGNAKKHASPSGKDNA